MSDKIKNKNIEKEEYFKDKNIHLGNRELINKDKQNTRNLMTIKCFDIFYTIVFNGQIYNKEEIKIQLKDKGFESENNLDAEIVLKAFICFGTEIFKKLNGVFSFAIWNNKTEELYLVRDHFGIKPLYYTFKDSSLIFSTEVKGLLEYPGVETKIDSTGICELFGLGPAHTPGSGIFKGIKELKPAHFLIFNKDKIYIKKYWSLESKEHTDNFEKTCEKIRFLLEDSIEKQMITESNLAVMLSGGLDSSIITAYASKNYKKQNKKLETFSIDYVDNDKNFVKTDFQPNSDNYYIDLMRKKYDTQHKNIVIDTPELIDTLEDAMAARDFPGMADVDSSLLLFCNQISKTNSVVLSGECSDEIFGGYPWFFRKDALESNTFPWSIALEERQEILNSEISKQVNLKAYVDFRYNDSLIDVRNLVEDSKETADKRKISYLTTDWFMQTLLDRADRMSKISGLEIRVPFCDYRIVEYMWNVPWEMKALDGREKGLLRYVVKDLLPEEIVNRKKSPYPKTHNPNYLKVVKEKLARIMENKDAPINDLLNKQYILEILESNGKSFRRPWFGQLMTGPQLMAYLIQVNMWLEKYQVKIEL